MLSRVSDYVRVRESTFDAVVGELQWSASAPPSPFTIPCQVRGKLTVLRCITYIIFQFIGGGAAAAISENQPYLSLTTT